ncbi:conserved hypothetical protein [Trichinella spiralis]|uniref:hypothetical protein n=1 Tax=Trichinella spiralis TaxID=6334 RepID=UPI0001EFD9AE|nr:conserved hypothetical protein [Trichinella spiralis]
MQANITSTDQKPGWLRQSIYISINHRRKLLRLLREQDNESFENVLNQLKIAYYAPPLNEDLPLFTRKGWIEYIIRRKVEMIKEDKLRAHHEILKKRREIFLTEKEPLLAALNEEEKAILEELNAVVNQSSEPLKHSTSFIHEGKRNAFPNGKLQHFIYGHHCSVDVDVVLVHPTLISGQYIVFVFALACAAVLQQRPRTQLCDVFPHWSFLLQTLSAGNTSAHRPKSEIIFPFKISIFLTIFDVYLSQGEDIFFQQQWGNIFEHFHSDCLNSIDHWAEQWILYINSPVKSASALILRVVREHLRQNNCFVSLQCVLVSVQTRKRLVLS